MARGTHSKKWLGLWAVLVLVALGVATVYFWEYLPYQRTVAKQLKSTLESYGLTVTSLDVDRLNQSELELSDIRLGAEPGLAIDQMKATYTLPPLQNITQLDALTLHDVSVETIKAHIYMKEDALTVSGLEPLLTSHPESSTPFDTEAMLALLPQTSSIKTMVLSGADAGWSFSSTLRADFNSKPEPALHAESQKIEASAAGYQWIADEVKVDATIARREQKESAINMHALIKHVSASGNKQQLTTDNVDTTIALNVEKGQLGGAFSAKNVLVSGLGTPIPLMQVSSDFTFASNTINATIRASDKSKAHQARVAISLPVGNPSNGTLTVQQLHFPWGGGKISLKPVTIPLALNKPIQLGFELDKVELVQLLATLGEGKISGTGEISGVLPITYHPNGTVTLQDGNAAALTAGTISVAPSLLPGDNAQLAVARTTLENFHYTKLGISVSSDKKKKSTIHLTLQGNNPDAFDGRQVNLNVNLTGDVLPLIQQSVLPINNLKALLTLQGTP